MAWVKPQPSGWGYVLSKSLQYGVASYALYAGGPSVWFYIGHTNGTYTQSAGTSLTGNGFHHVVGTFDGTQVRLFVDGTEVGTGVTAPSGIAYRTNYENGSLLIGAHTRNGDFNWGNVVDEVAVFGRALSSNEIAQIYQQVLPSVCSSAQAAPTITLQPQGTTVATGQTATFSE